ncbi:hypothetical protein GGI04_001587 [Coemansia thaxteri]|uniref:Very-long-chain (3R)-3-hydroxyacyl-CoA dehydratase n=1 Tax=Coemansia thaxteri TaxID=2663907 RepID=A0A9W8BPI5_9FUNG|nr:hypothetical protein GGI04_001587 [Coemansia thaxteri]KAJ2007744.1 hypothetical protein H4R26_000625 [Coemansia thaxteri]KAJ2472849.1 hypothetical protein GGI02_001301 [Coemansia sp. RSA 2322]KAJ2487506.1 hypothetical protein EV174_000484 [Coemansia sp. RSA 2320]
MAKSSAKGPATTYLVAYNAVSFGGWAYVLVQTVLYLLQHGTDLEGLFARVGHALIFIQTGAALEVVHSLMGLVRSGVLTALMQVYSRLLLVWGALYMFDYPEIRASPALVLMVLAWSVTECVRYSHYALGLVDVEVPILLYLRYTLFYVLYPAGVTGELLVLWAALPHAAAIHPALRIFFLLNMAGYPPVLYKLYTHMIYQRRKILGGHGSSPRSKAARASAETTAGAKKKKL